MADDDVEPGDLDDDLPPLIREEEIGETLPGGALPEPPEPQDQAPLEADADDEEARRAADEVAAREAEALRTAADLRSAALAEEATRRAQEEPLTAADAMRLAMAEADEPRPSTQEKQPPSEATERMIAAIARDDFEECEAAILQGADLGMDCGGGMHVIHIAAMRGEIFLVELLLAQGANVNHRDMSGNTPLLYACHFFKHHGKGVEITAQLLFHKADPFFRVKDGKLAGTCALDLVEKACREPQVDESAPRQMRAMIKLAMDGGDDCHESITKVWMGYKSQNKKLYEVSSKNDNYKYVMKNIDWVTPDNAKGAMACSPVKLDGDAPTILGERFVDLKEYLFTDEGDKVKVYVTFPELAAQALGAQDALGVEFEFQAFDVKLRTPAENYRLRVDPLFGSIDATKCKHRASAASRKVTLTLAKRHLKERGRLSKKVDEVKDRSRSPAARPGAENYNSNTRSGRE
eukprot:CAMPEP_0117520532 /NCGR_PEP_ID=MMETSP0784-20121206/33215_1 /TAXON_ID=39447 /ORGANISM="" /LENGTH=463 /DNA_ID=CAMNT_0005316525 /DNA_START=88 /DNA_END=1477 /DNA_ORIENTATION=+